MTMLVTDAKPQIDSSGAKPLLELIDRRQQQQFMAEVLSSAVMGTGIPTLIIDPRSDLKNSPAIWRVNSIDESAAKQISQAILDYKAGWGMTLATLKSTREFDVSRDGQKR